MSLAKLFEQQGQGIVADLRASYAKFGVNASGDLSKTTESRVEVGPSSITLQIIINAYGLTLEPGRGPTKNSQGGVLYAQIRRWVDDKGIGQAAKRDGIAYAITKTIHEKGTKAFRDKDGPKVISSVIDERLIDRLTNLAANTVENTYLSIIEGFFQNARSN